jgi:hypothetical protein
MVDTLDALSGITGPLPTAPIVTRSSMTAFGHAKAKGRFMGRNWIGIKARASRGLITSSILAASMIGLASTQTGAAPLTSVTNLSVSPTSTVAGVTTNWSIDFTTSSFGTIALGDTVSVELPTGTGFGSFEGGTIIDTTTGNWVSYGDCANSSGTTVTCTMDEPYPANPGDDLSVVLTDVTNPATAGSATTSVWTSSDTQPATQSVTFTAPHAVADLSVTPTSRVAGATTNWTIGFTTSSTGAMAPGGTVTVKLPRGTTFGSFEGGTITDVISDCANSNGTTVTCTLNDGAIVSAGEGLSIVLTDVTNPATAGSATTTVWTSSDTRRVKRSLTFSAPHAVKHLSVILTSTAASATTNWTIDFTTSSTGAMVNGGTLTLNLPAGTTFGSFVGGRVTDTATGNIESNDCANSSGTTVTCPLESNDNSVVNAGDMVSVLLPGVTNPTSAGTAATTVWTSSDPLVATQSVTLTQPQAVANLSVTPTSTAVGATASWRIDFTTSSTGALTTGGVFLTAGSLTVNLPTGTTFGPQGGVSMTDTTTGNGIFCTTSGITIKCLLSPGQVVNADDVVSVVLTDVINPMVTGSATTTVSTTSDTLVATQSVTLTTPQAVTNLSVLPTSKAAGRTTNWRIGLTTSSTGAMAYPGGTVSVTLPTGTTFGSFDGGTVTDTTTGKKVSGNRSNGPCTSTSGTTVTCTLKGGYAVNAGDVLSVLLTNVTNPTLTGSALTSVSTSSDTKSATKSVKIKATSGP